MASESRGGKDSHLRCGQKIRVEIENCSAGVLVVIFKHEKSVYRGVLLDTHDLYHGINQKRLESQVSERMELSPSAGGDDDAVKETQLPCSMERHTYKVDGQAIHPAFPQHPIQRQTKRPHCTRARILRPRRFICRKCKNLYQFLEGNGRVVTRLTDNPRSNNFRRESVESENDGVNAQTEDDTLKMVRRSNRFKQRISSVVHDISVDSKSNDSGGKNEIRQVATPIMPRLRLVRLEKQKNVHSSESECNQSQTHYRVATSIDRVVRPVNEINGTLTTTKISQKISHPANISPKIISHVSMTSTQNNNSRLLRTRKSRQCTTNSVRLAAHDAIRSRRTAKKRKASMSGQRNCLVSDDSPKSEQQSSVGRLTTRESRERHAKVEASQKIISTTCVSSAVSQNVSVDESPSPKRERRAPLHNEMNTNPLLQEPDSDLPQQYSTPSEHTNVYEFDDSDATATGLRPEDDLINKRRLEHIPPKQRWRKEEELRRIQDERSRVFGKRLGHSDMIARLSHNSQGSDCETSKATIRKSAKLMDRSVPCENSTTDGKVSLKIKINRSPTKDGFYRCQIVDKQQNRRSSSNACESPDSSDASSTSLPTNTLFGMDQPTTSSAKDGSQSSNNFTTGDVVWGKILGWPWWPSVVKRIVPRKGSSTDVTAEVQWLNWDQVSYIPIDKIVPFVQYFGTKFDRRKAKRRAYKSAVDEAVRLAKARCGKSVLSCSIPDNHPSTLLNVSDATSSVGSSQLDSGGQLCSGSTGDAGVSQHTNGINNGSDTVADLASADRAFDSALQNFSFEASGVDPDGIAPPDPLTPLPDLGPSLSRAEEWCMIAGNTLPTFSDDDDEDFNAKLALDPASIDRIQAT